MVQIGLSIREVSGTAGEVDMPEQTLPRNGRGDNGMKEELVKRFEKGSLRLRCLISIIQAITLKPSCWVMWPCVRGRKIHLGRQEHENQS